MNNSDKGDFYFGISENKVFICFFEKKKDYLKKYIDFEIPETLNNNLNFKIISNLLKNNIRKLEKSLGIFLTNGNVSIKSKTNQSILLSIKNIFDEKKLDENIISKLVQSGIKYFNTYDKELLIIHVIINKYTIDGKTYNFLPHNIKFKNIILELEFICLDKNLVTKIKRLFTECGININKIVSYEYAKKFLKVEKDITLCLSAKEVINGANYSEVKIQEEPDKKTSIFNKIFNVFD